jgi:hypothetical protein
MSKKSRAGNGSAFFASGEKAAAEKCLDIAANVDSVKTA